MCFLLYNPWKCGPSAFAYWSTSASSWITNNTLVLSTLHDMCKPQCSVFFCSVNSGCSSSDKQTMGFQKKDRNGWAKYTHWKVNVLACRQDLTLSVHSSKRVWKRRSHVAMDVHTKKGWFPGQWRCASLKEHLSSWFWHVISQSLYNLTNVCTAVPLISQCFLQLSSCACLLCSDTWRHLARLSTTWLPM